MANSVQGSLPDTNRRPDHWWAAYLDGAVWDFVEGEDFVDVERFRTALHNYLRRQNKQGDPDSVMICKVNTRRIKDDQGRWHLYVQAHYPNQVKPA